MENLKILNDSILNINEKDETLAIAYIIPFKDTDLISYIDGLIEEEIKAIKYFDDVEYMTDEEVLENFPKHFESFYEFKEKYKNLKNLVYIDLIENKGIKKGSALTILNYLKEQYEGILLFSVDEATSYWEKNGFKNVLIDTYYFYSKNDY